MAILAEQQIMQMIMSQIEKFSPQLKGYQVFLFGSRAMGQAKERSDFDIGVLGDDPLPIKLFYAMEDAFDQMPTLHKIDWMDFNRVSPKFRQEALKHIKVLYE